MSISDLHRAITPPVRPLYAATPESWVAAETALSVALPREYYEVATTYGCGRFWGEDTTDFTLFNPGAPDYLSEVEFECQRLREAKEHSDPEDFTFAVFPNKGGLLPYGLDDQNVRFCWRTGSAPDSWPIVIMWDWGQDGFLEFGMPLTDFLAGILTRSITLRCWPEPCFLDHVRFEPHGSS